MSDETPKVYRLGERNSDGSWTIEVATYGIEDWQAHETCVTLALASQLVQTLSRDEDEVFGRIDDGGAAGD